MPAAQTVPGKISGGWHMPLMEDGRLKTLLTGEGVEALAAGRLRISKVAIQIYDGQTPPQPRLIINAPECFFDMSQKQAAAAGPIALRAANGRYSIQGRGFSWSQTAATLSISNDVRTIISRPVARQKPGKPADSPPIKVRADRFDYNRTSNIGTYRGRVKATQGSRFQLRCGQLTVLLPEEGQDARTIAARGDIQIEVQSGQRTAVLTGETAHYQPADSGQMLLQLRGSPSWRSDDYEGRGEAIDIERLDTEPIFTVRENARMTMPAPDQSKSEPSAPSKIRLQAGSYIYTVAESKIQFRGDVQAQSDSGWTIASRRLTAFIKPENRTIRRIAAEGQVQITQTAGNRAMQAAGSAIAFTPLDPNQSDMLIEGEASIASRDFNARGDRIHLRQNGAETAVFADGNVQVELLRFAAPDGSLLSLAQAPKPESAQQSPIRIAADKGHLEAGKGRFQGNVTVKDAKGTMQSQTLDIGFGKTLRSIQNLKVSGNVRVIHPDGKLACRQLIGDFSESNVLRRLTTNGNVEIRNINGVATGRQAVYRADKGSIELSEAELRTKIAGRRTITTAGLLLWYPAKNTFTARGKFRSRTLP